MIGYNVEDIEEMGQQDGEVSAPAWATQMANEDTYETAKTAAKYFARRFEEAYDGSNAFEASKEAREAIQSQDNAPVGSEVYRDRREIRDEARSEDDPQ